MIVELLLAAVDFCAFLLHALVFPLTLAVQHHLSQLVAALVVLVLLLALLQLPQPLVLLPLVLLPVRLASVVGLVV